MLAVRNNGRMMPALRHEDPVSLVRAELDNLFNRFFGNFPTFAEPVVSRLGGEMKETESEIILRLDAPGFETSDFEIQVSGEMLTIKAERKDESNGTVHRQLERSLTLPAPVVADKVEASYRNGVVELKLPKAEVAKWHKIAIKSA